MKTPQPHHQAAGKRLPALGHPQPTSCYSHLASRALQPASCSLRSSSCNLKSALCIHQPSSRILLLQPASRSLHPTAFILHPATCTPHPASFVLRPACCNLHPSPILHSAASVLYPRPCIPQPQPECHISQPAFRSLHPAFPTCPVNRSHGGVYFAPPCSTSHRGSVRLCSHCPALPSRVYPDTRVGWPRCPS